MFYVIVVPTEGKIHPSLLRILDYFGNESKLFCDSALNPVWFYSPIKGLGLRQVAINVPDPVNKTLDLNLLEIMKEGFYYCFGLDEVTNHIFISEAEVRDYGMCFTMCSYKSILECLAAQIEGKHVYKIYFIKLDRSYRVFLNFSKLYFSLESFSKWIFIRITTSFMYRRS